MFLDSLVQLATAQPIVSTTTSMFVYDVTGAGVGVAPLMIGGVTSTSGTLIGFDIGAGDGIAIPEVYYNVSTAFTSAANANLTVQLQAAPDSGVGNLPGTFVTIAQSGPVSTASLTASFNGQFQVPPVPSNFGENNPRFYRLNYVVGSSTFSAGNLSANIVLNPSQAQKVQNNPANYVA